MNHFILFLLLFLVSCASEKLQLQKTSGIASSLKPYVANFKLNHPSKTRLPLAEFFPVNFDSQVPTAGVCYLREEVKDREVLVNPETWEKYPEKRQFIIDYLLSACYGLNAKTHPHYQVHLQGF